MATILTVPFTISNTTRVFGPFDIDDSITTVRGAAATWSGSATLSLKIEISFDGGVTWRSVCAVGPTPRGALTFKGRGALWLQIEGVWRLCQCGEVYTPNHPANPQLLVHSDHAFQDISRLPNLSSIVFHNPDLAPAVGLPLRQVRVTATAVGNINSTFTADVS